MEKKAVKGLEELIVLNSSLKAEGMRKDAQRRLRWGCLAMSTLP